MGIPSPEGGNRPPTVAKPEASTLRPAGSSSSLSAVAFLGRSPWWAVALGGVLMGLTPDPINFWPLAWVAIAPLWRAVVNPARSPSIWRLFCLGSLWSGVYHGVVLSWITNLHPLMWMGVPWLGSIAIALFAWAFITGLGTVTFGLWAVLLRRISDGCRLGWRGRILLGTALWCLLETMLSWGPLAWPFLAFTQSPGNLWILHLGRLAGPAMVTAAIVAVNGCWAEMSLEFHHRRPGRPLRWSPLLAGIVLLLGLHGVGAAMYAQPLGDRPEQGLKIGLIQGNIPTREKLTPAGTRQAMVAYTTGYRALVDQGADAVLTPEGAVPERWTLWSQRTSPILQAVREEGVVLWLGTFRPTATSAQQMTQSLVNLEAEGRVTGQYNKVKLVPLGEYIPFEAFLGRVISRLSPMGSSLLPGSGDQVFETPFGKAIIGICYESAYSDLFRRQAYRGAEWIMTASNNDPYPPRMMRQHHAQDVMRAIETDRWAVRVTNTGISGLVDPHGKTHWLSEPNEYVIYLAQIYRRQTIPPYVRWGNSFTYGLGTIAAIVAWVNFRKKP